MDTVPEYQKEHLYTKWETMDFRTIMEWGWLCFCRIAPVFKARCTTLQSLLCVHSSLWRNSWNPAVHLNILFDAFKNSCTIICHIIITYIKIRNATYEIVMSHLYIHVCMNINKHMHIHNSNSKHIVLQAILCWVNCPRRWWAKNEK